MQHPIGGWEWIPHSEIRNAAEELADSDYPEIRLFDVPLFPSPVPVKDLSAGSWEMAGPESLANFSAPAWFFSKKLHGELDIPIGIIHSSWGGTSILTWTNEQTLQDFVDSLPRQRETDLRYFPQTWGNQVQAANEHHRIRRNKLSHPDPEVKRQMLEPGYSATGWKDLDLFDDTAAHGQVLWIKQQVNLEQELATADLTLQLGFLDRQSHVYWNGQELGYFQYPAPVSIRVPAAWIMGGINEITVRLSNPWGGASFHGAPEKYAIANTSSNFQLSLASGWKGIENQEPIPPGKPFYVNEPSFLFNGMISPLIPYGIKGFIWDQGGADARRPELYAQLFKRLIRDWRAYWKNEKLPFLFVQNTGTYSSHEFEKRTFVRSPLREAQETALELPHTGMVVSIDIGDPYDVHPKNKQEFGRRLALQALEKVYGRDMEADGPYYGSHQVKGDTVVVHMKDSGQQLVLDCTGESCGFELADADGVFHPANAVLQGNTIRVHSGEVTQPSAIRYAWGDYPQAGVFNQEGLPLAPFRVTLAD
ncbi:sialate O-acetylesterase [Cyclobacterium plantarum]|uniref:sialate O-acetylesterase n=1 Tax=Cyclobacterium plantarum TaxID=2716263 RepID=UPI003F71CF34